MRGRRHTITIIDRAAPTSDAEGRPVRDPASETTVAGFAAVAGARALEVAAQLGVEVDVVVEVPLGTAVDRTDRVRVDDGPVAGEYAVEAVTHGPAITRVFAVERQP